MTKWCTAALVVLDKVRGRARSPSMSQLGHPVPTVRHLLSHASGLPVESDCVLRRPERRRIYSNRGGYEVLGELLERRDPGRPFATPVRVSAGAAVHE